MIPIGTLHLDPAPKDLEGRSIYKYESYKVVISVKRPDEEMIRILGRTTTILSIFELVLTIPLVWFVWTPLCFLLAIPLIFRVAALPTKCFPIQSSPLFVLR
ncbi:hypothetical protein B9Z55_001446 [Caenorhabditis nigoni]|uniref:Uncharacterized protein n=1 Tax=Caenorhabditis nigoni TaxID=1611254 RepID=A0A2G5VFT0_9PELO|nr:hypothetical protein B9Z55_001446 [Caenorhabditis nigoni]